MTVDKRLSSESEEPLIECVFSINSLNTMDAGIFERKRTKNWLIQHKSGDIEDLEMEATSHIDHNLDKYFDSVATSDVNSENFDEEGAAQ